VLKRKLLAILTSSALLISGATSTFAASAPNATVLALHKQASAPASTERLLSLPRIISKSDAWNNQYGCTPVIFIAARGSSESPVSEDVSFATNTTKLFTSTTSTAQMGRTLDSVIHSVLESKLPVDGPSAYSYRGVGPVANMAGYGAHSALTDFFGTLAPYVAQGGKAALATTLQTADSCPASKLVLIGYSQGATIIRAAASRLSQNDNAFFTSRVLATVLVADPSTSATGSLDDDSLAKSLNTAMAPASADATLDQASNLLTCPAGELKIGARCIHRDGFIGAFGNGAWATNANYRPAGWPMLNTGDAASAGTLANSGTICLERDAICNTAVVQGWNPPVSGAVLSGHEVYLNPSSLALPVESLTSFVPTLQTWLGSKGVWNAAALTSNSSPVIKFKKVVSTAFRVCPAQAGATLAISNTNGFPSREGASVCNYATSDPQGALFVELARTKADLAKSSKKLTTYVGAPALNWKTLPKNRTKIAFLRITNSLGRSTTIQVALPLW